MRKCNDERQHVQYSTHSLESSVTLVMKNLKCESVEHRRDVSRLALYCINPYTENNHSIAESPSSLNVYHTVSDLFKCRLGLKYMLIVFV